MRKLALAAVPKVCRTATHLFQFVKAVRALGRGWGRSLKTAIANWYNSKSLDDIAYQAVKYREREGYSHKRLLQTAHPAASESPGRIALYRWMRGLDPDGDLRARVATGQPFDRGSYATITDARPAKAALTGTADAHAAGRTAAAAAAHRGVRDAREAAGLQHAGAAQYLDRAAIGIADADQAAAALP